MMSIEGDSHAWGTRAEDFIPAPVKTEIKGAALATNFGKESSRNLVNLSAESLGWLEEDVDVPSRRIHSDMSFTIASVSSSNEVLNEATCAFTDQERSLGSALVAHEAKNNGKSFDNFTRVDFAGITAFIKRVRDGYDTTYAFMLSRTSDVDYVIEELKSHGEWEAVDSADI